MVVAGQSTVGFKGKRSSQQGDGRWGRVISFRSGDSRGELQKARIVLVFLWTRWRPGHNICESARLRCKAAFLRAPSAFPSLRDGVLPAASARRLSPRGPQAIYYIKQNSNHTRVSEDPQRLTCRETRLKLLDVFLSRPSNGCTYRHHL